MSYLIVDDDVMFAELVAVAINAREVRFATNMQEAIAMIDRQPPNYIVLDLSLPDSKPEQTMALIRRLKDKSHGAHIIVISGYDSADNRRRAVESGADMFLAKDGGDHFFAELSQKVNEGQRAKEPCASRDIIEKIEQHVVDLTASTAKIPRLTMRVIANLMPLLRPH